jgi:plastocyanin
LTRRAERSRRAALHLGLGAACAAAALAWQGSAVGARPRTYQIVIQALQYSPATLKVRRGDVVIWINKDPFPHTATAPGAFDSKSIAADGSWHFTANRAGTFGYICTLHPNMKGTLEVE